MDDEKKIKLVENMRKHEITTLKHEISTYNKNSTCQTIMSVIKQKKIVLQLQQTFRAPTYISDTILKGTRIFSLFVTYDGILIKSRKYMKL